MRFSFSLSLLIALADSPLVFTGSPLANAASRGPTKPPVSDGFHDFIRLSRIDVLFSNSLIIHDENTREVTVLICINFKTN